VCKVIFFSGGRAMTKDSEFYELDDRELAEMIYSPVCNLCKRFSIVNSIDIGIHVCDAFPDGIPEEIWRGDNNHTKPYPGDNGRTYAVLVSAHRFSVTFIILL
jgi:hypothetical protein